MKAKKPCITRLLQRSPTLRAQQQRKKQAIAASASDNYLKAQAITADIKKIDTASYTESRKGKRTTSFRPLRKATNTIFWYLKNIAYLAASDSDYSMLADTFLYFAMEAQTKMEEAPRTDHR